MSSSEKVPKKELDHILIYREDRDESDRLFGRSISHAKRQSAIMDVIKRERMVEKVKRRLLTMERETEAAARAVYLLLFDTRRRQKKRHKPILGNIVTHID